MSAIEPGRNDSCPCGSGRKYKHCCLQQRNAEAATRSRLREAEARVVPELFRFVVDRWGERFFAEAWAEFFLWDAVPEDVDSAPEFGALFMPWFVFCFDLLRRICG